MTIAIAQVRNARSHCPACGDAMPDFDMEEEPPVYSLIQQGDKTLAIEEGYIKGNVFFGSSGFAEELPW